MSLSFFSILILPKCMILQGMFSAISFFFFLKKMITGQIAKKKWKWRNWRSIFVWHLLTDVNVDGQGQGHLSFHLNTPFMHNSHTLDYPGWISHECKISPMLKLLVAFSVFNFHFFFLPSLVFSFPSCSQRLTKCPQTFNALGKLDGKNV